MGKAADFFSFSKKIDKRIGLNYWRGHFSDNLLDLLAATGLADESTIRQSTKRRERELEDTQVNDYLAALP